METRCLSVGDSADEPAGVSCVPGVVDAVERVLTEHDRATAEAVTLKAVENAEARARLRADELLARR